MKQGTIIRMVAGRNFAFVREPDGSEYFFHRDDFNGHWNDLERDFFQYNVNIPVSFEEAVQRKGKGLRAHRVTRLDFPNQGSVELNTRQLA